MLSNQKVGIFVPKSERECRVNNVRQSHFSLGSHSPEQAKAIYETTNKYFSKQATTEKIIDHSSSVT
jgi:hypothetical protein